MIRYKTGFAALLLLSATAVSAHAQDLPMVDGVGSYTHSQIMRHQGEEESGEANTPVPAAAAPAQSRPPDAELRRMMAELEPEYRRRVRADGQASADRWLADTAYAMGQQDGAMARREER
jgi:hypothetical protein